MDLWYRQKTDSQLIRANRTCEVAPHICGNASLSLPPFAPAIRTGMSTALSVRDSTQYLVPKNPVIAARNTTHPICAVVGIRISIQTSRP
jgi:hypothetical protein